MEKLIEFLNGENIEYAQNASLAGLSSFKIGGNARLVCYPESAQAVACTVKYCIQNGIPYFTFGRCSNVLFSDSGIKSLIIKTDRISDLGLEDGLFCFGAGVMLARASKYTVDNGFRGMEFAYGIPGSVGGAVYMNAGAYGGEMSQCVVKTEYVDENGEIKCVSKSGHGFGYRKSFFTDSKRIITKTYVSLEKGDREEAMRLINELQTARKSKQPLDMPSAGSVFKRPEGYFAGKLIQDCGLAGVGVGGAQVSTKHCGFIVNSGAATAHDVKALISLIQNRVLEKFGIRLECELKFIED